MVTSPLYQPAAFASVVGAPASVGAVLSMLMLSTLALAVLPALSTALPSTDWFPPSLTTSTGAEQLAMPDSASEHSKDTLTSVLFQPKPLPSGWRLPLIDGAMPSIFSMSSCPASVRSSTLPALSTLQKAIVWMPLSPKSNGWP